MFEYYSSLSIIVYDLSRHDWTPGTGRGERGLGEGQDVIVDNFGILNMIIAGAVMWGYS